MKTPADSAAPGSTTATALSIAVAINPRAAFGGKGASSPGHTGELVVARLRAAGHTVTVLRRRDYHSLSDAVDAEISAGANALVVVGGDGMVHLGVNAVAHTKVPLGIIPAGTGNDAARGLGLELLNPGAAVEHFLTCAQGNRAPWIWGGLSAPGSRRGGL